jgi:glycosyltransferase involved in cell wall biosynthesis
MSQTEHNAFTISAVIPAYNAAKYIGRAIDSVLMQSRAADEIIVVDDGSTDGTGDVVSAYGSKVKYIRQENAGASAARNAGIKAAACEWIAFLDSDDEWLKGHLQTQMELLKRNPELVWSTGNFYRCLCGENKRGVEIAPAKAKQELCGKDYTDDYFDACIAGVGGWTGTMVIKRNALIEAGLFRKEQVRANDLDMWWRLAFRYPEIGYAAKPLAIYHMGTPDSIAQGYFPAELYCELINRHRVLAAEYGRCDVFERFASVIIRRWMRAMLFDARGKDIREMMNRFKELLPAYYRMTMQMLTAFPKTTAGGCHLISRIVRALNLRRKIVRRPSK